MFDIPIARASGAILMYSLVVLGIGHIVARFYLARYAKALK